MKEEQMNSMLNILGILIGAVFFIEIFPVIVMGMLRDVDKIKELIKEYKRLGREKK